MRGSMLLPLWLAAAVAGSPLAVEKRQQNMISSILGMVPSYYKIAPSSIKELKPKLRDNAIRKVARYGPFTLPANKVHLSSVVLRYYELIGRVGISSKADGRRAQSR
jgi:hypothetical protein